jgi:hypothetical protein
MTGIIQIHLIKKVNHEKQNGQRQEESRNLQALPPSQEEYSARHEPHALKPMKVHGDRANSLPHAEHRLKMLPDTPTRLPILRQAKKHPRWQNKILMNRRTRCGDYK